MSKSNTEEAKLVELTKKRPLEQRLTFSKRSLRMNTRMALFGQAPIATDWQSSRTDGLKSGISNASFEYVEASTKHNIENLSIS